MDKLNYKYGHKSIQDIVGLFERGQLDLEPDFQRDSVWQVVDRQKLIESILQHYPMPSIFLYKRVNDDGRIIYDVIDGKQRLETILMFQGVGKFRGKRFSVPAQIITDDGSDEVEDWDWNRIQRREHEHRVMGYEVQTVEIEGGLADIIDLFVRINSTGKSLTSAEKRHAKYFRSSFLKTADQLANQHKSYFLQILKEGPVSRKKHIELVCELLASIHNASPIDKKKAIDKIIGGLSIDKRTLERCAKEFSHTLQLFKRMFPEISSTRFTKVADFYSLFLLIHELKQQGCILNESSRNRQAQELLVTLTLGVDQVRQQTRRVEGATPEQDFFRQYLITVQGNTDGIATRKTRAELLRQLVGELFDKKDGQRYFTIEQRRLIWHSDEAKVCRKCKSSLTWDNFTIDHVVAHSRGGRTAISNAALLCRKCNPSKGAK